METDQLIGSLARDLSPVRRLRPPLWRLCAWAAVALAAGALVVVAAGPRPELPAHLAQMDFSMSLAAALVTALAAGWAALAAGVPGSPRWTGWLPVAPLAWWLATLGHQCWQDWLRVGPEGIVFNPEFGCFGSIALVGAVPALVLVLMIRRGARFHSATAIGWGALAVAMFANAAHLLFHEGEPGMLGVMVQSVSVALILAGALALRRPLLDRRASAA
jgi:hypothetical protein